MTNELNNIFKQLIQQCNIEAISTKDLATTLTRLYSDVENLSKKVESEQKAYEQEYKKRLDAEKELTHYKLDYVEPKQRWIEASAKLERQQWEFDLEKKYMEREVRIYKEIVQNLTAMRTESMNESAGNNGAYRNYNQFIDKPSLP